METFVRRISSISCLCFSVLALLLGTMIAAAAYAAAPTISTTTGPNGEKAVAAETLTLTSAEESKIRSGNYSAALLWHTSSDFISAVTLGAQDEFKRLGIKVVGITDAGFDSARQKSDVETIMAKTPNVILSLPVDPVSAAEAFRSAKEKGVKLVFLSNVPKGYRVGSDYVAIVTDDLFGMGRAAADELAKAIGGKGEVAWLFHDANYYVTNQRDRAVKQTLKATYPNIKIVAEQGIADPARAEEIAQALLAKHPNLAGIYVPWAEPAEGVLAALRAKGNHTTKLVTLDLSEPLALDMVKKGNVAALVSDKTYLLGKAMATAAAYGLLGKQAPEFLIVPVIVATKSSVAQTWQEALHRKLPNSVDKLLK